MLHVFMPTWSVSNKSPVWTHNLAMWLLFAATVVAAYLISKLFSSSSKTFYKKYAIREVDTSRVISKLELLLGWKLLYEADNYVYQQLGQEKFGGMTEMGRPMVLIKDVELLKRIFIKDFDHFVDRRDVFGDTDRWMKRMLFFMTGEEWKGVRSAVSPTFTTGKIRRMMEFFNSVGIEWVEDLKEKAKQSEDGSIKVDLVKTVNNYTVDVIASTAFGVNAGTIKNPNSKFAKHAFKLIDMDKIRIVKFVLSFLFPKVFSLLKISMFDREAVSFFQGMLDEGFKSRMNGDIKRNDFLQMLAEAKKGELKAEGNDELSQFEKEAQIHQDQGEKKQWLTDEVLSSQSMVFFFAGYNALTLFITFVIYVFAEHQDVQERVREEVSKIVKEDGTFDYDDLGQLVYLDMVIDEVNRKYPSAGRLERLCVKDYKDPVSGLCIPKGTNVVIPLKSFHHDKQYFHNADQFDPSHFSAERKAERNPYVYMPFGIGPRNCIGMRFAVTETKAAIAHAVHNFWIHPTEKTPLPVRTRSAGFQEVAPKDLEVKLTPIH